jgi:hypothetical protein
VDDQFGEPAEVLRDGGERELVLRATCWTAQPEATKPQDALEVGAQHLDALAVAA